MGTTLVQYPESETSPASDCVLQTKGVSSDGGTVKLCTYVPLYGGWCIRLVIFYRPILFLTQLVFIMTKMRKSRPN